MNSIRRVVVIDSQPMFRIGLMRVLEQGGEYCVVGSGATSADALRLVQTETPDLLFLDTHIDGCGIATAIEARRIARHPLSVMFLTSSESREVVLAALRAGAAGYMLKVISPETLLQTLRMVQSGETYVMPQLASKLLLGVASGGDKPDDVLRSLTAREAQILAELGHGYTNKEIGRRLNLSEKTVKHHMGRVLQKLNVRNRTEAVIMLRSGSGDGRDLPARVG